MSMEKIEEPKVSDARGVLFEQIASEEEVQVFLNHVVCGRQNEAQQLLEKHPNLLLMRGNATDLSGRTFKNVTAFQCAVWAWDVRHMCQMMLACLPPGEEQSRLRAKLKAQFQLLKESGVEYEKNGKIYCESYFDFKPIRDALKLCIDNDRTWTTEEKKRFWATRIKVLQDDYPPHVVHHYCESIYYEGTSIFSFGGYSLERKTVVPRLGIEWYSPERTHGIVFHIHSFKPYIRQNYYMEESEFNFDDYQAHRLDYFPEKHLKAIDYLVFRRKDDLNVLERQLTDASVTLEPWDGSTGGCILS